jgi:hypothetical protein
LRKKHKAYKPTSSNEASGTRSVAVRAVDVEFEGDWDMHGNMGSIENGWLSGYLADLAGSISAFREDLGVLWARVTVVTVTEFGRRVSGNESNGTEHGWGSSMFVAGGGGHYCLVGLHNLGLRPCQKNVIGIQMQHQVSWWQFGEVVVEQLQPHSPPSTAPVAKG